ncbi:MAG: hypothetical protein JSU73_01680 [candidate division WOR-3 bacterium]|nr:MAG: hypothetical protein JSU73_01680 [candidate division WOR-3 bacterium]
MLRASVIPLFALAMFFPAAADTLFVSISDSLEGTAGDTLTVPVLIQDQVDAGVIGVDMTLTFRESVLQAQDWHQTGRPASGWMVAVNPLPGSLLVAMAGATELQEGDTLLLLRFDVLATDTSTIAFARCQMNEGQVACSTRNGMFWPASGVEESATISFEPTLPTVVRGVLPLAVGQRATLVGVDGRCAAYLTNGSSDLSGLKPGVYLIVPEYPSGFRPRRLVLVR